MGTKLINNVSYSLNESAESEEEINISSLSDSDLYNTLKQMGLAIGPIVATSRQLYEKRLHQYITASQLDLAPSPAVPVDIGKSPSDSIRMRTQMADGCAPITPQPSETIIEQSASILEDSPEILTYSGLSSPNTSAALNTTIVTNSPDFSCSTPQHRLTKDVSAENPNQYFECYSQIRCRPPLYSKSPEERAASVNRSVQNGNSGVKLGQKSAKNSQEKAKSGGFSVSSIIELLILLFLVAVGYMFYQEMKGFNDAAKSAEHVDSL